MYLLDVNLLVALSDADHEHHGVASRWFRSKRLDGWATCPLTENGLLRVLGHPNYPEGPGTTEAVRSLLASLRTMPGHVFWSDSISFSDSSLFPSLSGVSSKQLTDIYLLALANQHGAKLATLDSRIDPTALPDGKRSLLLVRE